MKKTTGVQTPVVSNLAQTLIAEWTAYARAGGNNQKSWRTPRPSSEPSDLTLPLPSFTSTSR